MASEFVLDASAILADLYGEPGGEIVREAMDDGRLSAVNLAEIVTKLVEDGLPLGEVEFIARHLSCTVEPADRERAITSGALHGRTRRTGVSLGDRFCLALASELAMPVLTADKRWTKLDVGVEVRLIR